MTRPHSAIRIAWQTFSFLWCLACAETLPALADAVTHGKDGNTLWISSPSLRIDCDLRTGTFNCRWRDGTEIEGIQCAADLSDGRRISSSKYSVHLSDEIDVQPLQDKLGAGTRVTVHHQSAGSPELRQQICVYKDLPYFVTWVEVVNSAPVASNHIEPVAVDSISAPVGGLHLPGSDNLSVLFVPFDNDGWVRFNNSHDPADPDSYEVTAIYDNVSRRGVVLGSITHDMWKTGIEARKIGPHDVGHLLVYGGAAGPLSRDSQPHGMVSGTIITSPHVVVGSYADWRDGLEDFGRANARITPPLRWDGGVVFGWNSWAAYRMHVDYEHYIKAADFVKEQLQPAGFVNQGTTYINWDSGWNKCTPAQIREGVKHLHANGQKAGIYFAPFGAFTRNLSAPVDGFNEHVTWNDLALKDAKGRLLPKLDGGQPLDASNPLVLHRIDRQLAQFVDWGFDFVKLDFLNFASVEGAHADPNITTGIEAYNLGMKRIVDDLDPQKIGRPFFISLSIAPIFPSGYGHSRRISCDVFGQLENTEYLLNSVTYGWWMNKTLYAFNDPDHIVLFPTQGDPPTTEAEARSRLNASLIAGTMMIDSDDLTDPQAQQRALKLLTNTRINALAASAPAFRPVEGNTGSHAADTFVHQSSDGKLYIAIFNFSNNQVLTKKLNLERLGLLETTQYRVSDLWTGHTSDEQDTMTVIIDPGSSKVFEITKRQGN